MPLIKRKILPIYLSRKPEEWKTWERHNEQNFQGDYDLAAVSNVSLCSALRQLSSILLVAEEIHKNLQDDLSRISDRTLKLSRRLSALEQTVVAHNPKTVCVPESDLRTFSERKHHFISSKDVAALPTDCQFTRDTRPPEVQELYDQAAPQPTSVIRGNDEPSGQSCICHPVLGDSLKKEKLRKLNLDIETRRPASFVGLREWCSDDETLQSEVDLAPVSPSAPPCPPSNPHPLNKKLPLPEQRLIALSAKYPPKTVAIDVSGRGFRRMELFRQSLIQYEYGKAKRKRRRLRRRNTIADSREVRTAAILHVDKSLPSTSSGQGRSSPRSGSSSSRGAYFSFADRSLDITIDSSSTKTDSEREVPPNLLVATDVHIPFSPKVSLCSSSRHLKTNCNSFRDEIMNGVGIVESDVHHSSPKEQRKKGGKKKVLNISFDLPEVIYPDDQSPECSHTANKDSSSCESHKCIRGSPENENLSEPPSGVKLREGNSRDEGTRSSSGNWSGSSSPRTSFESDSQNLSPTDTTNLSPRAQISQDTPVHLTVVSPTSSFEQDSTLSESYQVRYSSSSSNLRSTSAATDEFLSSSSYASDGTLTPTQDIQDIPFLDDDTSSAFSCDAEGYYTSFHIDSGLRSFSYEGSKLASDSDCDAFARGSTGTTNSSASLKTVIMRNPEKKTPPKPPQRVSSLERKENRESIITVIHVNGSTSSREDVAGAEMGERPVCQDGKESVTPKDVPDGKRATPTPLSGSAGVRKVPAQPGKVEIPETHAKSAEKDSSFKMKTAINASGIPSLCAITPPQSDDEGIRTASNSAEKCHQQREVRPQKSIVSPQTSTPKSKNLQTSAGPGIRQPGDGEVAPAASRNSPCFSTHSLGRQNTPSLTLMSQKRDSDQPKNFVPVETQQQSVVKSQPEQYSLGKSVLERRNEIQLKVLGDKKPSSDVLMQRQNSRELQTSRDHHLPGNETETSNIVSLKELPQTTSSTHPFSAIPASVKQNVVITPTNSLERRKANSKLGAHVTLDSEGKVVYSSDSLPRKKVEPSTFEPGPYIKPPPISTSSSVGQTRTKLGYSSIQNMPLPPVPGETRSSNPPPVTPRSTPPSATATGLSHPNSMPSTTPTAKDQQHSSNLINTTLPQQPKLGTQSQVSALSQTLSGLSSHLQPRTVSQINSMRFAKDSKSLSTDSQPSSLEEPSEDASKIHSHPPSDIKDLHNQAKYNQRFQQQVKEQLEMRLSESRNSSQPVQETSMGNAQMEHEEARQHLQQHMAHPQEAQQRQVQQNQNQVQLLQQLHHQAYQTQQQQQLEQYKLQQQVLQHHRQQQQQLQELQEQQHLQQMKEKHQIIEQQMHHKSLPKHLMQQLSADGQQSLTTEASIATQKDSQLLKSQEEALYQTRLDIHRQQLLQQSVGYQQAGFAQQQDHQMTKQQLIHHNQHQMFLQEQYMKQHKTLDSQTPGPTEVIVTAQGTPMSPHTQRNVAAPAAPYLHVQSQMPPSIAQQPLQASQAASSTQPEQQNYISRAHQSTTTYHIGPTSRAPTPIQGLSTTSPHRLPAIQSSATLPHNRSQSGLISGMIYGSERSLHSSLSSSGTDGRGTPIPRPVSASPPPYDQYNLTNSDIYGRIGMTRQVQVGGTLPAGFGRNQRAYSSLPPNLRHPVVLQQQIPQQQHLLAQLRTRQANAAKTLTRRASVAGTETSNIATTVAGAPATHEKVLEKKEKTSSKKEKEKDKDKKKKESKNEKPPKKKWFWTLPLRRKKNKKDEEASEDDDGGFKDASQKSVRKPTSQEDTSFVRYPSPDTGSSDLNSSYSSDLSSGDHGYRSSPSSEVYYYSQKCQQNLQQHDIFTHQLASSMRPVSGAQSCPPITANNVNVGAIPRSHPTTPVSPPDAQMLSSVPPSVVLASEGTDITDLTRERHYMTREAMYAAMRHPQYYNYNRNSLPGMSTEYSQNSTPTSSRSSSPAVFGVNPLPPYTIRPQVRDAGPLWPSEHIGQGHDSSSYKDAASQSYTSISLQTNPYNGAKDTTKDKVSFEEIEPPAGYGENVSISSSPTDSQEDSSTLASSGTQSPVKPLAKQTTLTDFKKMILEKSMKSAGGRERVSAVEMLRASRPSIYGYSPPPAPLVVKPQEQQTAHPVSKGEGIIIPPNSRNTARALLFQSRFGSGRRFRTPKTEIISTTILEDKQHEEEEERELAMEVEESEEESEETTSPSSTASQQEGFGVKCMVKVPQGKATSEPNAQKNSDGPSNRVIHSTPIKPQGQAAPEPLDLSIIVCTDEDREVSKENSNSRKTEILIDKDAVETAL